MKLEHRMLRSIAKRSSKVILRQDVARLGSASGVSLALAALVRRGKLVRLGAGVYAKTKISSVSGNTIPAGTLDELSVIALERLGVEFGPSLAVREYNAGRTTQVPAQIAFDTGRRRIRRKLSLGAKEVHYERSARARPA